MLTYKPSNFRKKESPINYDRSLMSKMLRKHILYIYYMLFTVTFIYVQDVKEGYRKKVNGNVS